MVINTVLRIRTGVWRMPDMSNFLPFATTHSRPCLTRDLSFFPLAIFIHQQKKTRGRIYPTREEGWRLCLCFFVCAVYWATVQQKVLLFEAVSDCACFFRSSIFFFWEHTRLLDDDDDDENHDDDE